MRSFCLHIYYHYYNINLIFFSISFALQNQIFVVTARKTGVDEVMDPYTEISKEDAALIDTNSIENGFVDIKLDPRKFGRVVAQNSKNNFRQGVRESERGHTLAEFQSHTRELLTAVVQKSTPKQATLF